MTAIDHRRAGKRARRRGANGENEVRDLLREYGWTTAHRNFMSGGDGGGDLADAIPDFSIEIKLTERLDQRAAWRQANASARPTDTVLVAHRANFQPWLGTVLLTDLIGLQPLAVGFDFAVITPRQGLRAEFLSRHRLQPHPALVHELESEAAVTVLLTDLLVLLREERHDGDDGS